MTKLFAVCQANIDYNDETYFWAGAAPPDYVFNTLDEAKVYATNLFRELVNTSFNFELREIDEFQYGDLNPIIFDVLGTSDDEAEWGEYTTRDVVEACEMAGVDWIDLLPTYVFIHQVEYEPIRVVG